MSSTDFSKDQNFDDRAKVFRDRIYGTDKGLIRLETIRRELNELLPLFDNKKPLRIIDAGGGFGTYSRELAMMGNQVTVTDISEAMLDIGRKETQDLDFPKGGCITFQKLAIQELPNALEENGFDIVICHAVLEWLDTPLSVLSVLAKMLKEGGLISLLVYNRTALLYKSLIVGNYKYLESGMKPVKHRKKMTPPNPLEPSEVISALEKEGFSDLKMTGIRVFHDYMARYHLEEISSEEILKWELKYGRDPRFAHLGRYVHIYGFLRK